MKGKDTKVKNNVISRTVTFNIQTIAPQAILEEEHPLPFPYNSLVGMAKIPTIRYITLMWSIECFDLCEVFPSPPFSSS